MVIDIWIVWILPDSLLEAIEGLLRITLFHVYTGDLNKTLGERRHELDGLQEVLLGTADVTY